MTITKLRRYSKDVLKYKVSRGTVNRWLTIGLYKVGKLPFEWRGGVKVIDTDVYEKFLKHELYSKPEPSPIEKHGEVICERIESEKSKSAMIESARKETETKLQSFGFRI